MIWLLLRSLVSTFKTRRSLALENLALRQQLAVLQRSVKRPRLSNLDRGLWVLLRRFWTDWAKVLVIVKPDTVVRWHRAGFRRYWTWRSRRLRPGRPCVAPEVRELIRNMCRANPLWGAPPRARRASQARHLHFSGRCFQVHDSPSQATVPDLAELSPTIMSRTWCPSTSSRCRPPPSGFCSFSSFSITIAGASSISMSRSILRQSGPRRQIVDAFPWDTAPRYLLRDRDGIYGPYFKRRVAGLDIEQVPTAPRSPWQSPYVERVIGSIRRECLDHVIILDERHLRRILRGYVDYYHSCRTHLSLEKDAPEQRPVQWPSMGRVTAIPKVGGLHHYCSRLAA